MTFTFHYFGVFSIFFNKMERFFARGWGFGAIAPGGLLQKGALDAFQKKIPGEASNKMLLHETREILSRLRSIIQERTRG